MYGSWQAGPLINYPVAVVELMLMWVQGLQLENGTDIGMRLSNSIEHGFEMGFNG